jgi:hypothetical protein
MPRSTKTVDDAVDLVFADIRISSNFVDGDSERVHADDGPSEVLRDRPAFGHRGGRGREVLDLSPKLIGLLGRVEAHSFEPRII